MDAKAFVRTGIAASAVLIGVLGARMSPSASVLPAVTPAFQVQLPDKPGRDAVIKVCGICHPSERAAAVRLTREGWEEVVADMVRRGARPTDEERTQITEYLATNFLGEAARPLNLNSASQLDLEIVAGLLRKEAAAVLAYLKDKGHCTALADLKKVSGLDYKKIEDRKDFLVCFPPIPAPPIK
jgi:competence protein ComEA